MATQRQIEANRRNALKSTGPRTATGKAVSRFNALDHGLRAKTLVLPNESAEEFTQLCHSLEEAAGAQNEIESRLLQHAAEAEWRLTRGAIAERRCYDEVAKDLAMAKARKHGVGENGEVTLTAEEIICATHSDKRFNNISAHIARNQRAFSRAINDLMKLRKTPLVPDAEEIPEPAPEPAVEPAPAEPLVVAAAGAAVAANSAADPAPPVSENPAGITGESLRDLPKVGFVCSAPPASDPQAEPNAT
jgi:hypothetical protein